MPDDLVSFGRDRLDAEIMLIRERDALLAELLDCPVPTSTSDRVRLRPGSHLQPGRGLDLVLRGGWCPPEEWGVWSEGFRSALQVPFDRTTPFPITVELELHAFSHPALTQSVTVSVKARSAAMLQFEPARRKRVETIEINAEDLSPDFSAEIAFDIANPTAPADVESSSDRRKLGVGISGLRIP